MFVSTHQVVNIKWLVLNSGGNMFMGTHLEVHIKWSVFHSGVGVGWRLTCLLALNLPLTLDSGVTAHNI